MKYERCKVSNTCKLVKKKGKEFCERQCEYFYLFNAYYSMSLIPEIYVTPKEISPDAEDIKVFEFLSEWKEEILDNIKNGRGLYLYSPVSGNGKTTWATNMAHAYIRKIVQYGKPDLKSHVLFISIPDFLQSLRDRGTYAGVPVSEVLEDIEEADLVIWDDLGQERPSDWTLERLSEFFTKRYNTRKSQIFTSNAKLSELVTNGNVDSRIQTRIQQQCKLIQFRSVGKRGENRW